MSLDLLHADFLVIGSGIAGLRAALELQRHGSVLVVTKDQATESSTGYAQGGVAVALGATTTPRSTSRTPCGPAPASCAEDGRASSSRRVRPGSRELHRLGDALRSRRGPRLHFTREAAHTRAAACCTPTATRRAWEMVRALLERRPGRTPAIDVLDLRLLHRTSSCAAAGCVAAAASVDERRTGRRRRSPGRPSSPPAGPARSTPRRPIPPVATGDGMAMALRAGAALVDMEFVQFHPTALAVRRGARASSSPRPCAARARCLRNARRRALHGRAAAPGPRWRRATSSRERSRRAKRGDGVLLDLTRPRPPSACAAASRASSPPAASYGLDITPTPRPGDPGGALHHGRRGAPTLHGRTSVPGLYAAGEVACTGVHGANRLA